MNPLFNMLMGNGPAQQGPLTMMGPIQKANAIYQAMQNPAEFVRRMVPDLPPEISNDPNKILQYLQQTRGISNEQIQQIAGQIPRF